MSEDDPTVWEFTIGVFGFLIIMVANILLWYFIIELLVRLTTWLFS